MTPAGKACTTCGETLPLSDFYPSKTGRYGRESKCRACKVEYKRAWRRRNPGRDNYYTPKHSNIEPPPGLHAPIVWAARLTGAPADAFRNHACPLYDGCLGAAAGHKPELDFSCRHCEHESDRQAIEVDHGDLAGCIGLLLVVLGGRDLPNIGGVLDGISGRLGEMISTIAGERGRPLDEPHWGRPGPE